MFNISNNYVKFFPDLVGVEIPDSGRKTKPAHAMLWGYFHGFEKCPDGCYSSIETAAEACKLSVKTAREVRSDLLRLNWISVKRNRYNKITNVFTRSSFNLHVDAMQMENENPEQAFADVADGEAIKAIRGEDGEAYFKRSNPLTSNEVTPLLQMKQTQTGVATPVPKESNKKTIELDNSSANRGDPCCRVSSGDTEESPSSSRKEMEEDFPFDEKVETHSIRPGVEDDTSRVRRAAWALVNECQKSLGLTTKPHGSATKNVMSLMSEGVTMTELRAYFAWTQKDDFYKTQPLQSRFTKNGFERWKLGGKGGDDGWRPGQTLRWNSDHSMLVKCDPETGEIVRYD